MLFYFDQSALQFVNKSLFCKYEDLGVVFRCYIHLMQISRMKKLLFIISLNIHMKKEIIS